MKVMKRGKGRGRGLRGAWAIFYFFFISFNFCGRRKELVVKLLVEEDMPVTVLILPVVNHGRSGTVTIPLPLARPDL